MKYLTPSGRTVSASESAKERLLQLGYTVTNGSPKDVADSQPVATKPRRRKKIETEDDDSEE